MHPKEIQIVRFSMVVLFSALMIVYLLLYQIKGNDIVDELTKVTTGTITYQLSNQTPKNLYSDQDVTLESGDQIDSTGIKLNKLTLSLFDSISGSQSKSVTGNKPIDTGSKIIRNTIKILSGTSLYFGTVESAEKVGINYQYALKDQKGIYYVYLGTGELDIDSNIRKLGGTIYKMTTEQEIMQNKLFGEKIIFINLPEYKDKKVLILATINNETWLLQIDYNTYYKSKSYIQNLFIK